MRYLMPSDGSYALQQDAIYTLPTTDVGPMDIAPATSLLWIAVPARAVRLARAAHGHPAWLGNHRTTEESIQKILTCRHDRLTVLSGVLALSRAGGCLSIVCQFLVSPLPACCLSLLVASAVLASAQRQCLNPAGRMRHPTPNSTPPRSPDLTPSLSAGFWT